MAVYVYIWQGICNDNYRMRSIMLKSFTYITALLIAVTVYSCKKDKDDNGGTSVPTGSTTTFSSDPAGGKMHGTAWQHVDGWSHTNIYTDSLVTIILEDVVDSNGCDPGGSGGISYAQVYFDAPAEVGAYSLTMQNFVTFSVDVNGTPTFYNVSSGAIEITAYDTANGAVAGKINARFDGQNFINGVFDVPYCW